MIFPPRCCPYCQQPFQPSKRRPDQGVCSRPACQARRRNEYRRRKRLADPEYAQVICDSRRKWREAHPGYQKNYWQTHPEAAARNRQQQRQRDQKRRVGLLVKNTLVLDLTQVRHGTAGFNVFGLPDGSKWRAWNEGLRESRCSVDQPS